MNVKLLTPSPMMYIAIVALILLSAFFSVSETAISTYNRIRIKKQAQDGDLRAKKVLDVSEKYQKTLSTILIGNNIVNIAASTIATIIATFWFGTSGAIISTVVMTLLILTFGEIIPKSYGMRNADKVALSIAGILAPICTIFTPLSFFFTRLEKKFLRSDKQEDTPTVTEEELIYMLDSIEGEGVIEQQERDLVQSALEFDEITIRKIITPRVNLVAIDVESNIEQVTEIVLEEGYSRIPVFEESIDNIIGILYARDFLRMIVRGQPVNIRAMITEPYFVPMGMRLSHLLEGLKSRKVNLAVVLDEYGGTSGIVTMEDLLEELVGDIWDEDDEIPKGIVILANNRYEVAGGHDVFEFFEELGFLEENIESDQSTVGGWATHMLEHVATVGEDFEYQNLVFTVLEMDGLRIQKLGVLKIIADDEKEDPKK